MLLRFTVLLLTPDSLAPQYGRDRFTSHETVDIEYPVQGENAARIAVAQARDAAMDAYDAWDDGINETDFAVIAVYPGHHDDCNPEA